MKLAIVGAAAFVVGLAGGTLLSPARRAVPSDSTHAVAPGADSLHAKGEAGADSARDSSLVHTEQASTVVPEGGTPSADSGAAGAAGSEALTAAIKKLPPAEAGPMVAKLADADAVAVLRSLPLPQASKILDAMTPEQAARLSKLLLLAGATP